MDNLNYDSPAARLMTAERLFDASPFVMLDVGCSGGIERIWRIFGESLVAHGFDPSVEECRRLQAEENHPNIHYHAGLVGLPEGHGFLKKKAAAAPSPCSYWEIVFGRSSRKVHGSTLPAVSTPPETAPSDMKPGALASAAASPPKIVLSEFVSERELANVDFLKVDTDGADLEVLLSAEPFFKNLGVLGALVECQFQGEDDETSNSFHNIDRLMKRHGLMIFSMSVFSFSRAALPAPYLYSNFAQTTFGQPVFGDVAFLRDPLWPRVGAPTELPLNKLLKLICLYEFFGVPDCAAEVIQGHRSRIAEAIDPDRLLDLLTPPLGGRKVTYQEYVSAVAANPRGLLDLARGFRTEAMELSPAFEVPAAVGAINPLLPEAIIEIGQTTRVVTSSRAWNYSAEIPVSVPNEIPGKIHVRIRARVVRGACAFGLLDREGTFQDRKIVDSGAGEVVIFLEMRDRSQAKCVVLEKASTDEEPAEILLSSVRAQTNCSFEWKPQTPTASSRTLRDRLSSFRG